MTNNKWYLMVLGQHMTIMAVIMVSIREAVKNVLADYVR